MPVRIIKGTGTILDPTKRGKAMIGINKSQIRKAKEIKAKNRPDSKK